MGLDGHGTRHPRRLHRGDAGLARHRAVRPGPLPRRPRLPAARRGRRWRSTRSGTSRPTACARDPRRPYVAVSNHESYADIFLICHFPWEMKWLSKDTIFKIPVMGWMMRMASDIRRHARQARERRGRARAAAATGWPKRVSVMIFPEGTRSRDGRAAPLQGRRLPARDRGGGADPADRRRRHARRMAKGSFAFRRAARPRAVLEPIPTAGLTLADVPALRDACAPSSTSRATPGARAGHQAVHARAAAHRRLHAGAHRPLSPRADDRHHRRRPLPGASPASDEEALEEWLSRPTPPLPRLLAGIPGDLIVLGAGGKMGPSLAAMARRAPTPPAASARARHRRLALRRRAGGRCARAPEAGVETIARRPARPRRPRRAPRCAERRLHGGPEVRHARPADARPGR